MSQTRTELEACVAACVLMDGGSNVVYVDIPDDDFQLTSARYVIKAARELSRIDFVIVKDFAASDGQKIQVEDLSQMLMILPTSKNFMSYLLRLKTAIYSAKIEQLRADSVRMAKNGDLLEIARHIQEQEYELALTYLERESEADLVSSSANLIARIENGIDNPDMISTGVTLFDEMLGGGALPGELTVIAARPSVGKTAFALQMCLDCYKKNLFFSLEMDTKQISPRLLSAISFENTKIANRRPSQIPGQIRDNLLGVSHELLIASERIVVIDEPDQTIDSIRRAARKEIDKGSKLITIDYLQLIKVDGDTREQAISGATRALKNMAKELKVPVFLLAQLNRACEKENRAPRLSDLRESGSIEQDANNVLFIHEVKDLGGGKKQVALIQAKGRDVGQSFRKAIFNANHQRFYPMEGE